MVEAGTAAVASLQPDAPIVLWSLAFGTRTGDELRLTITGPDGEFSDTTIAMDRTQALSMRAGGRNVPDTGWPFAGPFTGVATLMRDGVELDRETVTITLP